VHPDLDRLFVLVDRHESADAEVLFTKITNDLANDRDGTIESMRSFGQRMHEEYKVSWGDRALALALDAAWGPKVDPRGDALALDLVRWMVDRFSTFASAVIEAAITRHVDKLPDRAFSLRLAIAHVYGSSLFDDCVTTNLRVAARLARTDRDRLWLATQLSRQLRNRIIGIETGSFGERDTTESEAAAIRAEQATVFARCIALSNQLAADPDMRDVVIDADLEIAHADPMLAHRHATRAEVLSREGVDEILRTTALHDLANLLVEAELYERAGEVASQLEDEDGMPPILEEIRRKRGLLAMPPASDFVTPVGADDTVIYGIGDSEIPEDFPRYFSRSDKP
jgi:hypothetical protein